MIIYNVTCNIEPEMETEWLGWMLGTHIPEVMATGCFTSYKIMRLLTKAEGDAGLNFAIQYTAHKIEDYDRYQTEFGPGLRQKTLERYGDRVMAFRTLLEEIEC